MIKMAFRRKSIIFCAAALFITIMCFSMVNNASLRDPRKSDDTNLEAPAIQIADNEPNSPELENHAFQPDDINQNRVEDLAKNLVKEDLKDENKDFNVLSDRIAMDSQIEDLNNNKEEVIQHPEEVLQFKPKKDVDEEEDTDYDERGPPEQIFGVGERLLDLKDGKPIPMVRAPNKINAMVDARPLEKRNQAVVVDPLELDDLAPPDHLDAVRLEQDGHLNVNYQKEVFFGEHEDFENLSEKEMEKKLADIFQKVDVNENGYITVDELEDWIILKTNEHFTEAKKENKDIFDSLDSNSDGTISWLEFEVQFLMALGFKEPDAKQYALGRDDDIPLDIEDRERLIRFKYKWGEAEHEPQDDKLTLEEFQAFRHPESSKVMLEQMVQDILDNLDANKDGFVSEEEFIALPNDDYEDNERDRHWQKQRRKEFRTVIDTNHDGKVNKKELVNYVDPQNTNHAKLEARNLIELGDANSDDRLSLAEVIENMDLFYGSKMVNTALSFHDEF